MLCWITCLYAESAISCAALRYLFTMCVSLLCFCAAAYTATDSPTVITNPTTAVSAIARGKWVLYQSTNLVVSWFIKTLNLYYMDMKQYGAKEVCAAPVDSAIRKRIKRMHT